MDRYSINPVVLYVLKRVFLIFLFFLLILSVVLLFISFVQYSDIFITSGITLRSLIGVFLSMLPLSLEFAIPLSTMASLLYVVYVMIVKNEILAIELSGMERFILLKLFLIFSISVSVFNMVLSLFVFPVSIARIKEQAVDFARNGLVNSLAANRVNDDIPETMIFFRKKDDGGRLSKLFLFQEKESGVHSLIYADRAETEFLPAGLSLHLKVEDGRIIDREGEDLRLIDYVTGRVIIDIAEIIEKRIKHIRGMSVSAAKNDRMFYIWDSLYLSLINVWIAVVIILVFISNRVEISFARYILFFLLVGIFYIGFRGYHSLSENGIMAPHMSCLFTLIVMILLLMIMKGFVYKGGRTG